VILEARASEVGSLIIRARYAWHQQFWFNGQQASDGFGDIRDASLSRIRWSKLCSGATLKADVGYR
jgi:hypothetical protein